MDRPTNRLVETLLGAKARMQEAQARIEGPDAVPWVEITMADSALSDFRSQQPSLDRLFGKADDLPLPDPDWDIER